MATTPSPSLLVRLLLQHVADTGESPTSELDTQASSTPVLLSGFTDITPGRKLKLAPTADDYAVTFTSASTLVVFSHDYPFSYRLADGETLVGPTRLWVGAACDDETVGAIDGPILLTGNGQNQASLEIWIVEAT